MPVCELLWSGISVKRSLSDRDLILGMITKEIRKIPRKNRPRKYSTLESVISWNRNEKILLLVLIAVLTNLNNGEYNYKTPINVK